MRSADSSPAEEKALIHRVVALDDDAAFADLVRLHQSPVRQFLRRLKGGDLAAADDLAQETFWKAYRNLASYRGDGRLRSWLFKIAYQLFVSDLRRQPNRELLPLTAELPAPRIEGDNVVLETTVETLLSKLRDEERAAILLHFRHGQTHEEVAATLELPLGTIKSLIRRGKTKMREFQMSARQGGPQGETHE